MQVVLSCYIQSPCWQSRSCSEPIIDIVKVNVFISVLYMTKLKKSRLFGSTTIGVLTSGSPFAITIWTVAESHQIHRHKFYDFVLARFVPAVASGGVFHVYLLDIHIQRLKGGKGLQVSAPNCRGQPSSINVIRSGLMLSQIGFYPLYNGSTVLY